MNDKNIKNSLNEDQFMKLMQKESHEISFKISFNKPGFVG